MGKHKQPHRMDLVQRAIATEATARRKAEQQAAVAGAGIVYLQSLLAAVVQQAGGTVIVQPEELEPFAHPEPIATVVIEGDAIRLIAAPIPAPEVLQELSHEKAPEKLRGELRDGDVDLVAHPSPTPPSAVGLCQGCGNEDALFPKTDPRTGKLLHLCSRCLLLS